MYISNDKGFNRSVYIKNNVLQIFFLAFPIFGFITFLRFYEHEGNEEGAAYFTAIVLPFSLIMLGLFVFVTLRMMKRWNHTIKEVGFDDTKIIVTTFSVLWLKPIEYSILLSEIKVKKSIFSWYDKEDNNGATIAINDNTEIYLVKNYFDDFNEIFNKIAV